MTPEELEEWNKKSKKLQEKLAEMTPEELEEWNRMNLKSQAKIKERNAERKKQRRAQDEDL